MANDGSTAGLYILITFLILLVVGAFLYFGGAFTSKKEVDVNINTPGIVLQYTR
ncbi:MAG TPA: hypothetical protein VLD57_01110 [Blastocatellia bacterium]|nr:hypothetical protein [Blastocatellia bacterium]